MTNGRKSFQFISFQVLDLRTKRAFAARAVSNFCKHGWVGIWLKFVTCMVEKLKIRVGSSAWGRSRLQFARSLIFASAFASMLVLVAACGSKHTGQETLVENVDRASIPTQEVLPSEKGLPLEQVLPSKFEGAQNLASQNLANKRLIEFAMTPEVSERVRLVMGWLKFFRNKSILTGLSATWQELQSGHTIVDEERWLQEPARLRLEPNAFAVSKSEFRMWRELLRSTFPAPAQAELLDLVALTLAASEAAADLQELDTWLLDP